MLKCACCPLPNLLEFLEDSDNRMGTTMSPMADLLRATVKGLSRSNYIFGNKVATLRAFPKEQSYTGHVYSI